MRIRKQDIITSMQDGIALFKDKEAGVNLKVDDKGYYDIEVNKEYEILGGKRTYILKIQIL